MLNDRQLEAVQYDVNELLVLAGAGSGKTKCVTEKVKLLLSQGYNVHDIVAITFTNKAASEMKNRVSEFHAFSKESANICTFHSFCYKMIRTEIGYWKKKNVRICNDTQAKHLLQEACEFVGREYSRGIQSSIERLKNSLIYPGDVELNKDKLRPLYERYQDLLSQCGLFDFNDLISQSVIMLQKDFARREKYQRMFKYLIVDEFQDVNNAQFELVKALHNPEHNKLMVVGDDSQSIYAFRQSDPSFIIRFHESYPESKTVKLEQNYRSTGGILVAANYVIDKNKHGLKKELWTHNIEGEKITIVTVPGDRAEGVFIANEIEKCVGQGKNKYKDFAVLYRANAQSRLIENELAETGIPYKVKQGSSFFDRKEVSVLMDFLRFIDNPEDILSFRKCVQTPKRKIGAAGVDKIIEESQRDEISIVDVMRQDSKKGFKDFVKSIEEAYKHKNNASTLIQTLIDGLNFRGYLETLKGKSDVDTRMESILKLMEMSNSWAENKSLSGLLDLIALRTDVEDKNEEDSVLLTTIHSSKGLEFNTVFLIGMNKGTFPHETLDTNIEEARRLFYVAITRAEKKLYLTRSETSGFDIKEPSSFLSELPLEVVNHLTVGGCDDTFNQRQGQERQRYYG